MKQLLQKRLENQVLTKEESVEALLKIGNGEVNPAQIAAFLTSYAINPPNVVELEGFREAMLQLAVRIDLSAFDAMDVCGTGGDGKDTFNISTTSAFVIAGTGQKIAKNGNHGVSSAVGSSTVLENLGAKFTNDADFLKHKIETSNVCYMHAPLFHPAMKYVAPVRKELGFKTFFNILGPLLNPSGIQKQLTGTFNLTVAEIYAQLFGRSEAKFGIIHSLDGYDEISLTGDFQYITRSGSQIVSPSFLGFEKIDASELHGGNSLEDSAQILVNILKNEGTKAHTSVVLANSAVALSAVNGLIFDDALAQARESLESGRAYECLRKFVE
jgi:anthranilate phosphoribosyltransferase